MGKWQYIVDQNVYQFESRSKTEALSAIEEVKQWAELNGYSCKQIEYNAKRAGDVLYVMELVYQMIEKLDADSGELKKPGQTTEALNTAFGSNQNIGTKMYKCRVGLINVAAQVQFKLEFASD